MMFLIASNEAAEIKPYRGKPRNVTTVEMQPTKITQRRGRTVKFTGTVIAKGEFPTRQGFEIRMEVHQTEGGAYVAVTTTDAETRAVVIEPADPKDMQCAVMEAFDWHDRAKTMPRDQLKWKFVRTVD
ncbi:hypothetical protein QUC32_28415 (plasmid) [Novosphingobium resinovorum]|jgi:hypothetical protein|uniref:Uncharacterized protein n=1 Tax=Novosphingobium resinovorum TaxID=158500 RepID=A0A1D8AF67_9SPHN|nr:MULTISPECIES: hypothetical protein [Sphingomonadaceae]AOR80752.1 hypothetical protein BES08_28495 [Novosphingobium resinovorum]EJU12493.1 hypothetical protein LH128_13508 [Sphingomonas sp. LH128]MBF7015606.1 hypothetical protein [Novosphingobium sp. HR1a]WJM30281.1 hypothetical protein QUC32_28415 [Novosphingobium resinovorum]